MLKQTIHIVCSLWLAMLLLFGGTPKNFFHEFARHQDTVHSKDFGHDGVVIEKSHHHCSFLDFQLMPFTGGPSPIFIPFAKCADYGSYTVLVASRFLTADVRQVSLRGPPAFLA